MKTQIISADDLDLDRHVTAFREAFAHVGWREEIEPATNAEFFRWKYRTPYGDAVIAHLATGGRLISSASAFPLMLRTPAGTHLAWQVVDLITTPDARGQGLFRRCLAVLVNELGPKGPLICFPNRLSIGEIQRQGFRCVTELRTCARQTLVVRAGNSTLVQDSPPDVQTKATDTRTVCVCKDANYLNWRYVHNPARRYQFISECSSPESFAVVRELALPLGQRASVVMDMSAEEDADRSGVLRQVHQWAHRRGLICNFLFCGGSPLRALGKGYIPLPSWAQPKRHLVFMKFPASMDKEEMTTWRYAFQIGDWDGL
jgi:GNAT superfamily N-acetyltransferase